jgi:hypothetical protein
LDRLRPTNWLRQDSILRSFGHDDGPENIARYLDQLIPTLAQHPRRRFQIGENLSLQIWLCRANEIRSVYTHAVEFWQERVRMMRWWADKLDRLRENGRVLNESVKENTYQNVAAPLK